MEKYFKDFGNHENIIKQDANKNINNNKDYEKLKGYTYRH